MKKLLRYGQKLSNAQMKKISGGMMIPQEEYCDKLKSLFTEENKHNMSHRACEGAQEGARRAGCDFKILCGN